MDDEKYYDPGYGGRPPNVPMMSPVQSYSYMPMGGQMPSLATPTTQASMANLTNMAQAGANVASTMAPVASGASAFVPGLNVAMAGANIATDVIGLILQQQAMEEAKKEAARLERKADVQREQDIARDERWRGKQFALTSRQQQAAEKSAAYQQKWNEDERRYSRAWNFITNMSNQANSNIAYRRSFLGIRRAA